MKKPGIFGKAILYLGILMLGIGSYSCKEQPKTEDPKEVAEEENEAKFDETKRLEEDAETLVDAAEFDLMQRELGKLAQAKGVSKEVKDLGKMQETHHNESFNELTALAKNKQISIPTALTEDGQKEYEKLSKVEAKNFDKEYIDQAFKDHHEAIEDFMQDSQRTQDVEIKAYLEGKITTLNGHHDTLKELQGKINAKK